VGASRGEKTHQVVINCADWSIRTETSSSPENLMKRFALRSLRSQLLLAFGVLSLLPLIVLGVLSTREGTRELGVQAGERLGVHASNLANALSRYLGERAGDATVFAHDPVALTGTPKDLSVLADGYIASYPSYDLIVIADRDGKILATNLQTGDHKPVSDLSGRSVRGQAWFDAIASAPKGRLFTSPTLETDPLMVQGTHSDGKGITYAVGVFDDKGQLARVWSNHISWERGVGAIINHELAEMKRTGIDSAQIDLIDRTGRLLDEAPFVGETPTINLVTSGSRVATLATTGQTGFQREVDPIDHDEDVVGYMQLQEPDAITANGWAVLAHEKEAEVAADAAGIERFALIVGALAVAFVAFGALWFARRLTRRIRAVVDTLQRVAEGDLTARAQITGSDEISQMTEALHTALDRIGGAFSAIGLGVISISQASEDLTHVGSSLTTSADDTSRQAGVVATASEQAGKNVQTVATGTEEMSVTIKEIAKSAAEAAKVATAAVARAQRTNELVGKLGESSVEIGNVLKVITSIAEQTNLLALNATIEAARAGEAGKGFAVVANEVKELAKETARATEDITRKIEAIQSDTKSAVSAIGEITDVIGQINDIQSAIASAVEEQASTTNEIGRNLHELAEASNEIAQNVTAVATSAGSTSECSSQTRSAATSLADLSHSLDAQMRQFSYAHADESKQGPRRRHVTGTLVRVPPTFTTSPPGLRH
jgi:methyl-accepting chemotaxis protein